MERTAVCSCGQLSVTVEGDPEFHGLCNCIECQKVSGGPFTYSGYWRKSAVKEITGESKCWRRIAESGRWLDQYFCPVCSSPIFGYVEFDPELINIAIGSFADPSFPPPTYSVWEKFKHSWLEAPERCATFETQPASGGEINADELT